MVSAGIFLHMHNTAHGLYNIAIKKIFRVTCTNLVRVSSKSTAFGENRDFRAGAALNHSFLCSSVESIGHSFGWGD